MSRRGWNPLRAVMVLALSCLATVANAQYFGQNKVQYRDHDWKSIRSDHFEVFFDVGADSLAMRTLDLSEKAQALFQERTGHTLSKRIPIILYASHQEFAQTNITSDLIDGSTGGFTEALRDRVVVPFSGSYEDFRHVLVHELVHAFQFDIFYNSPGVSLLSGQGMFGVPLWFAEGMAEYFSLGMEPNAEMYVRDGTLTGYLPPLEYAGGYLVYKMGQSAIEHLIARYGEDRFREMLKRVRQQRNFERAFQRTYGMSTRRFDEQWRDMLRKRYWPTVAHLDHPEQFARRLTDHRRDESVLNFWPSISPDGDRIAYFSDRRQYNDVYVMSAFDGRVLKRVVRAERNLMFEAIPLLRTSIAWSPEGDRLALVASSGGRDRLYIVDADDGRMLKQLKVPDVQELLPNAGKPQEMNSADENAAMALGKPAFAYPGQDHLAHIQSHLNFGLDPMLGQSMLIGPKFVPQGMEHIKQHMILWYKEQMQGYVTAGTNLKLGPYEDSKMAPQIDKAMALASDHVKMDTPQVFQGVVQAMQQMGQIMQQVKPPQQPMDAEAQAVLQASMAETQRRAQRDQQEMTFKGQELQADIAMNAENNLTKERMTTAELTVDEARLQREQEETALKLQNTTQAKLGA